MSSVSINPGLLKQALTTAKIVKPTFGDFSFHLDQDGIRVESLDKRRSITSKIPLDDCGVVWKDEYFIPLDRTILFESDYDSLKINKTDKGLSFKYLTSDAARTSLIKQRAKDSKRPVVPPCPDMEGSSTINPKLLDRLLKGASCSALIKETHTEEDMRINQIHFYKDHSAVVSNARFYASVVTDPSITFDASIVSADIPIIRAFSARCKGNLQLKVYNQKIFIKDVDTGSYLHLNVVPTEKPTFYSVDISNPKNRMNVNEAVFKSGIKWSLNALDSTQRVTFSAELRDTESYLAFYSTSAELASNKVSAVIEPFRADFPAKVLMSISEYLHEGDVSILYGLEKSPEVLVFRQDIEGSIYTHMVRSMKSK